jgi:tripartite-type tricarboxylate transporter receptor subunit TctC
LIAGNLTGTCMRIFQALACLALLLATGMVPAQNTMFSKPVRVLVGVPPGGANDIIARIIAQRMEGLGQPVLVENRAGAAQMIAAEAVARAAPDGTSLLLATQTALAVVPNINQATGVDPLKDFAAVALFGGTPMVLVVNPSVPAANVRELIALIKASPGKFDIASGGVGTTPHMAGALFAIISGLSINNISYKGEQPALVDIMGGVVPMMFSNASAAMPHVRSGKLRGLAVTSVARHDAAPGLPTMAEAGVAGYEMETWLGLVAPAATPREVVAALHAEVQRAMALPDVQEKLRGQGLTIARNTPEQFGAFIRAEHAKWGKVIRDAGIKPE